VVGDRATIRATSIDCKKGGKRKTHKGNQHRGDEVVAQGSIMIKSKVYDTTAFFQ